MISEENYLLIAMGLNNFSFGKKNNEFLSPLYMVYKTIAR